MYVKIALRKLQQMRIIEHDGETDRCTSGGVVIAIGSHFDK